MRKIILLVVLVAFVVLGSATLVAAEITAEPAVDLIGTDITVSGSTITGTINERLLLGEKASIPEYKVSFYYTFIEPAPTVEPIEAPERPAFRFPFGLGGILTPIFNALFPTGQQISAPAIETEVLTFICSAKVRAHTLTAFSVQKSASCTGAIPTEAGSYKFRMVVDSGKDVAEINEGNNVIELEISLPSAEKGWAAVKEECTSIKTGESAQVDGYTIKADAIATASGGTSDAFITVCKGTTCSSSKGLRSGDTKDFTVGSEVVSVKLVSVAYGASICVKVVDVTEVPEEEVPTNKACIKTGGSAKVDGYTVTLDSIATASGGSADAFITVCKGATCSSSTGFLSGDTKEIKVGSEMVKIKLTSVAYGASVCVELISVEEIVVKEEVTGEACLKAGESADIDEYTIKMDSIATASGGTADVYLTVCKGDTCSASTGFTSGEKKIITVGSDKVTVKLQSVAYGASACVKILGVEEVIVEEEVTGEACLKAGESTKVDDYTVKIDAIATASGGTADVFLTVCKGDTCSASTGFVSGDTKQIRVGSYRITIKLQSVAYGASACIKIGAAAEEVVEEEEITGIACAKAGESVKTDGYTVTVDAIATASGGTADTFITVCKGDTCSASTGFTSGQTKEVRVGSEMVKVKVTSVAYGASVCFDIISSRVVVEEEVPAEEGCMAVGESIDMEGYTITATAIATASGGTADAYITVCKGTTCSAATGFTAGATKDVTVGSEIVKLKLTRVAYGAAVCVDIISTRPAPAPPAFDFFGWLGSLFG